MSFLLFITPLLLLILPLSQLPASEEKDSEHSLVPEKNWISDFDARLALARVLSYQKSRQHEALEQYKILLIKDPNNAVLLYESARIYMVLKKYHKALASLSLALELDPNNPEILLAAAQAEAALGHAKKSNQLMQKLLALYEPGAVPLKMLISYADLTMVWGDFNKAEQIYQEALTVHPRSLKLSFKLGGVLTSSQQYERAENLYQQLLHQHPADPTIFNALIQLKIVAKDFKSALEYLEQLLSFCPKPRYFFLQADTLFLAGCYEQALRAYINLASDRKHSPKAYVGIGKCYLKLNQAEEAETAFCTALQLSPKNIPAKYYLAVLSGEDIQTLATDTLAIKTLEQWAALSVENGISEPAKYLYSRILARDSEYFPAQIGLAEMLSIHLEYEAALFFYFGLLEFFPQNAKIMMSIARVYSWSKHYQTSLSWYDELIRLNPSDFVPLREKARVAIWGKMYNCSMAAYNKLLSPAYDDLDQLQYAVSLEKKEKQLIWNKRFRQALPVFEPLLEATPGNQEALFDYGQDYCSIGRCDLANRIYRHTLDISPNHTLIKMALERNEIRLNTAVGGGFTYWRELGSGTFSQSQIARYQVDGIIEQPLSCNSRVRFIQRQWVENPFYNFKFYPAEGQTIEGETVFNNYLEGNAGATYKNYFGEFKSRITGHIQLCVHAHDACKLTFGIVRENEVCNFFSIKQGIQYLAGIFSIASDITRYWSAEGTYWHLDYNDHNTLQHVNLMTKYKFTDPPNIFSIILNGDYYNTKHLSIPIFVGPKLVDVIHPYWTPQDYYSGTVTLGWRHDYRFFEYCEAPERYLDVKIIAGDDNVDNPSIELNVAWKHEFTRHWGFELKGLIHRSKQWNAEGAWASLSYRF